MPATEFTRRTFLGALALPLVAGDAGAPLRAVNVMNFIRAEEPRLEMDLVTPVREQMALIKRYRFPATWLFQYDALVEGPFVEIVKSGMPETHEAGLWFEINRKLCDAAGVEWRGIRDWEWDYHVPVAYVVGYTPEERRKLVDSAMAGFKRVWGFTPKSVACWNLDALTMARMSDRYGVEIFGVCRDQISTDGFTIWGAPIEGYYPSRNNAWSPAVEKANQIDTPVVRLLGLDPVRAYDVDGKGVPDTMEPVWKSGQDPVFVRRFLEMTAQSPCLSFAYAQLGQENSFGWPRMKAGYEMQMAELERVRDRLSVETMSETGRRFRKAFPMTPAFAQVQLSDPAEKTVWYQSRFYRANLHVRGAQAYFRDITVYSDRFPQPFLQAPTRTHGIEQRLPAVVDSRHLGGQGYFALPAGGRLSFEPKPEVRAGGTSLEVTLRATNGVTVKCLFGERGITVRADRKIALVLDNGTKGLNYRYDGFAYSVQVVRGQARGAAIETDGGALELRLAQV